MLSSNAINSMEGDHSRGAQLTGDYLEMSAVGSSHAGGVEIAAQADRIDATLPYSSVTALPAYEKTKTFTVRWSGSCIAGASIASYTIYVSDNGGTFRAFLTKTKKTSTSFTGQDGHTYGFYSVATDTAGRAQSRPLEAQTTTLVDATRPTSNVVPLSAYENVTTFTVRWLGSDGKNGSGVASYSIYVSDNGLRYTPLLTSTTQTSTTFTGQDGHRYKFYSVAADTAGNVQRNPSMAQATTTVDIAPPISKVAALPVQEKSTRFAVKWSGSDGVRGSGIACYDVYKSDNGGDFVPFLIGTTRSSATFTGENGHTYSFYCVAPDKAGNVQPAPTAAQASTTIIVSSTGYLSNGYIKIGVDLTKGGSITYLAQQSKVPGASYYNVVNSYDLGRQIQQSYYSGPNPYDPNHTQSGQWSPWPWNPIQSGDCYGHRSRVLEYRNDGQEIYVKTRPMQWALNNMPAEATLETWITLDGDAARVRSRLTNFRTDTTQQYWANSYQESPAVYTVGTLCRLFTYDGLAPFTGDAISELPASSPWKYWRSMESWAALVDKSGWGLGVYHPGVMLFSGGFSGTAGLGGPYDSQTGYMAPFALDVLDHNIVYEYEYSLILGNLDDIRQYVYDHAPDVRPDYRFQVDRQHWYCPSGDAGFPLNGALRVNLGCSGPRMVGPPSAWQAADVPTLYVTAAYHVSAPQPADSVARLYWEVDNEGKPWNADLHDSQSITFKVIPDGQYHTYALDLASCPTYKGLITQLQFNPIVRGGAGDYVDVKSITYRLDLA